MPVQNEQDQNEVIDAIGKTDASKNPATDPRRINERARPVAARISDREEEPTANKGLDEDEQEELDEDEREDSDGDTPIPERSRDLNVSKPVRDQGR